jgi:hypothetical protein
MIGIVATGTTDGITGNTAAADRIGREASGENNA